MRARYPAFAAACEQALGRSIATLEQVAIDRAVHGVEEPVWHAGKLVGTRVRFSDTLLKTMLQRGSAKTRVPETMKERVAVAQDAAKVAGGTFVRGGMRTADEAFESLETKLDRIAGRDRRDAVAQAEAWLAAGKIP